MLIHLQGSSFRRFRPVSDNSSIGFVAWLKEKRCVQCLLCLHECSKLLDSKAVHSVVCFASQRRAPLQETFAKAAVLRRLLFSPPAAPLRPSPFRFARRGCPANEGILAVTGEIRPGSTHARAVLYLAILNLHRHHLCFSECWNRVLLVSAVWVQ